MRPDLTVHLGGLTRDAVGLFAEIERPTDLPTGPAAGSADTFPSIGAFYDAILRAFRRPGLPITGRRQLVRSLEDHGKGNSLFALTSLQDVELAIRIIKEQGRAPRSAPTTPSRGSRGNSPTSTPSSRSTAAGSW
ncbi:ferritin-like domain-containing protein [Kitasatospora aburaviensis]